MALEAVCILQHTCTSIHRGNDGEDHAAVAVARWPYSRGRVEMVRKIEAHVPWESRHTLCNPPRKHRQGAILSGFSSHTGLMAAEVF